MARTKKYQPTEFMLPTSHYDKERADHAVNFIQSLKHTKGVWAGQPFLLFDWQEKIIRDLFGTIKANGYRQFNTAFVEICKKAGKSELAAAVALYMLAGDGEEGAEIYGCANDRQQASIVFDVAKDMVLQCPALLKRIKIVESQKRLVYLPTRGIYQVLSSEVATKHGLNVSACIFDELHTQPTRALYDVMTQGSGDARKQPLWFFLTTATASAGRYTKKRWMCWKAGRSIRVFIRLSSVFSMTRTGRARRTGTRLIPLWDTPLPSIRCGMRSIRRRKRLPTRTSFVSCA